MSIVWRAAWLAATGETKDEFVDLARFGERLLIALGGAAPTRSATTITRDTDSDVFSQWVDQYESAAAVPAVASMTPSVLFAGVSGWDPRADALVRAMMSGNAPEWNVLGASLAQRLSPEGVPSLFEWEAARGPALARGDDGQQTQERVHRGWWQRYIDRLPRRQPAPPPPPPPPPSNDQPSSSSGSSGAGIAIAALLAAYFASRRKRRR